MTWFYEVKKCTRLEYFFIKKRMFFCKSFIVFSVCDTGFTGPNCKTPCVHPSYGKDCHLKCSCSNISCHHVDGCLKNGDGTKMHTFLLKFSLKKNTDDSVLDMTKSKQDEPRFKNNTITYITKI